MNTYSSLASKPDILLIDDNSENLHLLYLLLSKQGYKVRTAINGKLALRSLKVVQPDLILLDINLPDMKGYDVCKILKAQEHTAPIPVIFLSALNEVLDKVKAFEAGGVDYITKPFDIQEVLVRVKNQLTISQQQKKLSEQQKQLTEQNAQLQLLLTTTKAINDVADFHAALNVTLQQVCEKIGWDFGEFWIPNKDVTEFEYGNGWYASDRRFEEFRRRSETFPFAPNRKVLRRICLSKQSLWVADVSVESCQVFLRSQLAKDVGLKACLGVPILLNDQVLAVLVFFKKEAQQPESHLIELVNVLASQLSTVIGRKRSESALRESQQQLAAMAASIPGSVYRALVHPDRTLSFLYVSEGEREISGLDPEQLMAEPSRYFQMIHPDDRTAVEEAFRISIQSLQPISCEYRLLCCSGEVKWIRDSIRCSRLENGEVVLDGVTLDISDRVLAEERLRLLDRAIAASSNGIIITDSTQPDNPIIYANPGFERITGYSTSEIIGKNCRFLQGHETNQPALDELRMALREERSCCVVLRNYRKDGTPFWNKFSVSPVRDVSRQVTHYIAVHSDITEFKQAESALQESEKRFRAIFEQAAVGIALISLSSQFLQVNQRCCDLLGYTESELLGRTCRELIHPEDLKLALEYEQQLLADEIQTYSQEKRYIHKIGQVQWVNVTVSLMRNCRGVPEYFIKLIEDISDRKQAQTALLALTEQERERALQLEQALQELQRTQSQLVQNEKMASLGQLVAGVAHELNNPTNFIYGNIHLASDYTRDLLHLLQLYQQHYSEPVAEITEQLKHIEPDFIAEDFPKLLASMREGADRIAQIVLSLRNFSRLDEAECKQVNIHEGIDNTLLILRHRLKQRCKGLDIQVIKDYGQLPLVECYPGQLNQVFINIISNAIDALDESEVRGNTTDNGHLRTNESPTIRIHTEVVEQDGVVIRIADNGSGIRADIQPKIFDPFFTTKPPGKGTGLGLSISYQIVVEKHGGQLTCHSAIEQGTEFVIALPTFN